MSNININSLQSQPLPKKDLSNGIFREEYKEFCKKDRKDSLNPSKFKSWSHKENCLKCKIGPLLTKHFQIPTKCIDFCSCAYTKESISNNYDKICRISLLDALSTYNYKTKAAKLGINYKYVLNILSRTQQYYIHTKTADFKLTLNGIEHKIDILKLKAGAIKRYTQPGTEHHMIGTAAFHSTSIFWNIDPSYYIEFRLKSKHARTLLHIDMNRKSPDVASWWYQCWSVFGVREYTKKSKDNGEYLNVDGVIEHDEMRLKPFVAAHHNDFVSGGDLKKSLNRIAMIFWMKRGVNHDTEIKINGEIIPLTLKKQHKSIKTEISSSEENELRNQYNLHSNQYNLHSNHNKMNKMERMDVMDESEQDIIDSLRNEIENQTQNISDLKRKIVTLEYDKLNLQNEINVVKNGSFIAKENDIMIKTEAHNDDDIVSLKHQIKSLQNELVYSQSQCQSHAQSHNQFQTKMIDTLPLFPTYCHTPTPVIPWDIDKEEEIRNLNNRIKILTNDNERLKAMNKNDRISFQHKIQLYHSHISREMKRMLNGGNQERVGEYIKQENIYNNIYNCNNNTNSNSNNGDRDCDEMNNYAPNPPSIKRQKLNDGTINATVLTLRNGS